MIGNDGWHQLPAGASKAHRLEAGATQKQSRLIELHFSRFAPSQRPVVPVTMVAPAISYNDTNRDDHPGPHARRTPCGGTDALSLPRNGPVPGASENVGVVPASVAGEPLSNPVAGARRPLSGGGRQPHLYVRNGSLFTSIVREDHAEEFIEVRNRSDGRLVTLIEVVSPANKTTTEGRAAYLEKRRDTAAQRAGIVEIDLVMQGNPTLSYSRRRLAGIRLRRDRDAGDGS